MRKVLVVAALAVMFGYLGGQGAAQQPKQQPKFDFSLFQKMGPMLREAGSTPAVLLSNASVQTELKMTDEQKATIREKATSLSIMPNFRDQEAMQKMMADFQKIMEAPEEKQAELVKEMVKPRLEAAEKVMKEVLKEEQIKRLNQIQIQNMGLAAFTNKKVIEELKLEDRQVEKFTALNEELQKELTELRPMRGGARPSREDFRRCRKKVLPCGKKPAKKPWNC
ncbi:MAG: hypothetical protein R3B84_11305 [Zavarzinella sp.]